MRRCIARSRFPPGWTVLAALLCLAFLVGFRGSAPPSSNHDQRLSWQETVLLPPAVPWKFGRREISTSDDTNNMTREKADTKSNSTARLYLESTSLHQIESITNNPKENLHISWSPRRVVRKPWLMDYKCRNYTVRFAKRHSLRPTALASFPGSGNTWVRYLLEMATGVYSGSVYSDIYLQFHGFIGEFEEYRSGTTIVQKTHDYGVDLIDTFNGSGILLVRNPFRAILSFHNYLFGGHTGHAPDVNFHKEGWEEWVSNQANAWKTTINNWTKHATRLLVVHYENIQENMELQIRRMLKLLRMPADEGRLKCLLDHPEGFFQRKHKIGPVGSDAFSENSRKIISTAMIDVNRTLVAANYEPLPIHKYDLLFQEYLQ